MAVKFEKAPQKLRNHGSETWGSNELVNKRLNYIDDYLDSYTAGPIYENGKKIKVKTMIKRDGQAQLKKKKKRKVD